MTRYSLLGWAQTLSGILPDPPAVALRAGFARNSLLSFCYLQLTQRSRLSATKPHRGFESLSLRHAVWTAENLCAFAAK
jgi:hypothetical protein